MVNELTHDTLHTGAVIGYAQGWQCLADGQFTHTFDPAEVDASERYAPEGWEKVGGVFPVVAQNKLGAGIRAPGFWFSVNNRQELAGYYTYDSVEIAKEVAEVHAAAHGDRVHFGLLLGASSGKGDNVVEPVTLSVSDDAVERACKAMWPTWRNPHLQVESDRERMREVLNFALFGQ